MTTSNPNILTDSEAPNRSSANFIPLRVVDNDWIEATVKGEVIQLSRWCPHEGADLAKGYISGGKLYCPWHGLEIDIRSGTQPCKSLKNLKIKTVS